MTFATPPGQPEMSHDHRAPRSGLAPLAEQGTLADVLRLLRVDRPRDSRIDDTLPIALWRVRQDTTLIHEGASGLALYVVRCGSLKSVKTLEDGYEQVLSFVQPGELVGFEALHAGVQPSSLVALEDSSVYALPVRELRRLQEQCPALNDALYRALSRQLAKAGAMAELMAAVASESRLARFLLWWSSRMAEAGQSPRRLHLRMSRRDIASLLGVAHETVSRSFTTLADAGCVRVDNREVEILDIDGLKARARWTRGPGSAAERPRHGGAGVLPHAVDSGGRHGAAGGAAGAVASAATTSSSPTWWKSM